MWSDAGAVSPPAPPIIFITTTPRLTADCPGAPPGETTIRTVSPAGSRRAIKISRSVGKGTASAIVAMEDLRDALDDRTGEDSEDWNGES
jgi:hypothetical protein